jgi:hypothetical protein
LSRIDQEKPSFFHRLLLSGDTQASTFELFFSVEAGYFSSPAAPGVAASFIDAGGFHVIELPAGVGLRLL